MCEIKKINLELKHGSIWDLAGVKSGHLMHAHWDLELEQLEPEGGSERKLQNNCNCKVHI